MRKGIKNIIVGVGGQLIIMALGIVVPRFILVSYGDEANGLINAIGQLFTYLALIEAGVGQSALQALYKPIANNDHIQVSRVIRASTKMFARLTIIYCGIVIVFALVYPLVIPIHDPASLSFVGSTYLAVVLLIIFQGISNAVGFYYTATIKQLLTADGCNYIIVNITTIIRAATSILRILLMNLRVNIVLLQTIYVLMAVVEAIFYTQYIKKKYLWLRKDVEPDKSALNQRNSFVVHEIANVIFSSTDVLVLSIFCDLNTASIYAIYNLVFAALSTLINQVHSGCFYILGQTYAVDRDKYVRIHDTYDTYYIAFVFSMITTAHIMILPFVKLYTSDVSNIQYVDPHLPWLFSLIQLLSCCRITSSNLIKIAGHAKATIGRAVLEAAINFIVSITLVNFIGIYGVLIGTIAALLYRTNDMIIYANYKILHRLPIKTYAVVIMNFLLFIIIVFTASYVSLDFITNYILFFVISFIVCVFIFIVYFTVNTIISKNARDTICGIIKTKTNI